MRDEMKYQSGFSMIKILFWILVIGSAVVVGYKIIPVYNAYWKAQDTFEAISRNMADGTERDVRRRLPEVLKIKYVLPGDLPDEFYKNIVIKADGNSVEISSKYHVTVWIIGPVQSVSPDSDYQEIDLKGMDKLRHKLRYDFDFEPHAKTP